MRLIINQALDFWTQDFDTEAAAVYLDGFLRRDGFQVSLKKRYIRMNGNEAEYEDYYEVESLNMPTLHTISLISLDKEYITEHIEKARTKIDAGDCAGAITSAYTLVEGFLKELLKQTQTSYRRDEGDIRELYKLVSEPLNLNPKGENLESYLKNILQGLKSQISGLYELANKASDRHARRYNPARHHAKLAVNAAFCLCEFLLDSYNYQRERAERKQAL
ncbi:MAG: abortive infection family protein [Vampirovibrionales bacterium]|nr:abortive infection family protein [Vampirovibrionales bacterium]